MHVSFRALHSWGHVAKLSRKWAIYSFVATIVVAITAYAFVRSRSASAYDELFPRIVHGMRQDAVEALLGPPTDAMTPEATARILEGRTFDDVDAPPVNLQVITALWYDGRDRRIRVELVDGKVWRAKLNGPGMSRYSAQ